MRQVVQESRQKVLFLSESELNLPDGWQVVSARVYNKDADKDLHPDHFSKGVYITIRETTDLKLVMSITSDGIKIYP